MVQVSLNGFFPADFVADGRVMIDVRVPPPPVPPSPAIEIHDARQLQARASSPAAFFAEHGFVLLPHASRVSDWNHDTNAAGIERNYFAEVEGMIREHLLPGRRLAIRQSALPLRRGHGTSTPMYGTGIHSDYGLEADDYQQAVEAFSSPMVGKMWRNQYDRAETDGFMVIDFWRTTHMDGPLKHMPLALCSRSSVDPADMVLTAVGGVSDNGNFSHTLGIRFNPAQKWYYYPDMTGDEVLAFKLFQAFKAGDEPVPQLCFHSAFKDPATPADAQPRQSCEHRVGVFCLSA